MGASEIVFDYNERMQLTWRWAVTVLRGLFTEGGDTVANVPQTATVALPAGTVSWQADLITKEGRGAGIDTQGNPGISGIFVQSPDGSNAVSFSIFANNSLNVGTTAGGVFQGWTQVGTAPIVNHAGGPELLWHTYQIQLDADGTFSVRFDGNVRRTGVHAGPTSSWADGIGAGTLFTQSNLDDRHLSTTFDKVRALGLGGAPNPAPSAGGNGEVRSPFTYSAIVASFQIYPAVSVGIASTAFANFGLSNGTTNFHQVIAGEESGLANEPFATVRALAWDLTREQRNNEFRRSQRYQHRRPRVFRHSCWGLTTMKSLCVLAAFSCSALGAAARDGGATEFLQAPIKRVGGPRLKISLNAYSFNKTLNDHLKSRGKGMTLFDLLDFCAEQSFDAIDPTAYFFPGYPKAPDNKYLNEFKRKAFLLGLDISGTGVRNNFASPDKDKRAADVQHVKEWIDVAARMGAPVLRVFAGPQPAGHTWEQVAEWMVEDLKKCVLYGKEKGVLIGIQNHGDMLKTGAQTLKIVKMVDSEWFGVIVDTGYFLTEDPYKDIAAVAPFAVNWQVKQHIGGKGATLKTDLRKIVRIAKEAGYRGYLPIETLPVPGEDYDPRARVRQCLKELREALQAE
jgi:sugar phosphate isomerase/epimerase